MNEILFRSLPSVDRLLSHSSAARLIEAYSRPLTIEALRAALADARNDLKTGEQTIPGDGLLIEQAGRTLEEWTTPTLRRVINATGVIIHTNLGRAPLSESAIQAIQDAASGYNTLEYDLESGQRGSRSLHAETLLKHITGAEAALVVNNNAAAVLLALTVLAGRSSENPDGRGVVISRGQLVEIGGGFRMPDVMAQSSARMIEIGTTNRTHLRDYEEVLTEDTAVILRVHRSNFAIIGFTAEPTLTELVTLAQEHSLLVIDDLGSGALLDTTPFGLAPEPLVQNSVAAGADLVMFSGDKLVGGPQAGILVGKANVVEQLKRHPLTRALRADKLCLAALTATLIHYLTGDALKQVPVWRMISMRVSETEARARRWADTLARAGLICEVIEGLSAIGGGSLPGETLPTAVLSIHAASPDSAAAQLRAESIPVIVRIEDDRLIVDPRTILERDEELLLAGLSRLGRVDILS